MNRCNSDLHERLMTQLFHHKWPTWGHDRQGASQMLSLSGDMRCNDLQIPRCSRLRVSANFPPFANAPTTIGTSAEKTVKHDDVTAVLLDLKHILTLLCVLRASVQTRGFPKGGSFVCIPPRSSLIHFEIVSSLYRRLPYDVLGRHEPSASRKDVDWKFSDQLKSKALKLTASCFSLAIHSFIAISLWMLRFWKTVLIPRATLDNPFPMFKKVWCILQIYPSI